LIATHSSEIVTEVEARDLVIVDKSRPTGKRTSGAAGVRNALLALGSSQNIVLSGLARTRRVLFVEGDDFKTIRQFARVVGFAQLGAGIGLTPYPLGGFPVPDSIRELSKGIEGAVAEPVAFAGVFDRDYRPDDEIDQVEDELRVRLCIAHVWYRKELENYLLVPSVLDRAIKAESMRRGLHAAPTAASLLAKVTGAFKDEVEAKYVGGYVRAARKHDDVSTRHADGMRDFRRRWRRLDTRLGIVPGKRTLSALLDSIQTEVGISLTRTSILNAFTPADISLEMKTLLTQLESFRQLDPDDRGSWPSDF
jgi:hypothetical protein